MLFGKYSRALSLLLICLLLSCEDAQKTRQDQQLPQCGTLDLPCNTENQDQGRLDQGRLDQSQSMDQLTDQSQSMDQLIDQMLMTEKACLAFPDGNTERFVLGDWVLFATAQSGKWEIQRSGKSLLKVNGFCEQDQPLIALSEDELKVKNSFGSFLFELSGVKEKGAFTPVIVEKIDEKQIRLSSNTADQLPIMLSFELLANGNLKLSLKATTRFKSISWPCQSEEFFFGLGTQTLGLSLNQHTYPLWTMEQGIGKNEDGAGWPLKNIHEAAYAPMGILHSSQGYSLLLGQDDFHAISVCENQNQLKLTQYQPQSDESNEGLLEIQLLAGDHIKQRMKSLQNQLGVIDQPPPWILGVWHDAVSGENRIRSLVNLLKENQIPSSAIWTEDWIGGSNTGSGLRLSYAWEWSEAQYPHLPMIIQELHQEHIAFLGYFNTFVPVTTRMYEEGVSNGGLVKKADGSVYLTTDPAFRQTALVDLTNPVGKAWFQGYLERAMDLGLDGWMADFTEWMPIEARLSQGQSGWEYHNQYPLDYQRLNRDAVKTRAELIQGATEYAPAQNKVYFPRSGWASAKGGVGGISPMLWGGDQNTDWSQEDGLASVISIATHVGLSGVGIFGSDIAGYSSVLDMPRTTKELFFRWVALGAFHPVMRTHHGSDECQNWAFDFDQQSLAHFKRYAMIHTMLYPYLAEKLLEYRETGIPITRHPWLEDSRAEFWKLATQSFFLGDRIYLSPVVKQGEREKALCLPNQNWQSLLGNQAIDQAIATAIEAQGLSNDQQAPICFTAPADISEVPAFIQKGTALILSDPMLKSLYQSHDQIESMSERANLTQLGHLLSIGLFPDHLGNIKGQYQGYVVLEGQALPTPIEWSELSLLSSLSMDQQAQLIESCQNEAQVNCRKENHLVLELQANESLSLLFASQPNSTALTIKAQRALRIKLYEQAEVFPNELRVTTDQIDLNAVGQSWCSF